MQAKVEIARKSINMQLGFLKEDVCNDLPCHSYDLGISYNYIIGELIGNIVDENTDNVEFISILKEELNQLGLELKETTEIKSTREKRIIIITRMDIHGKDGFICRDYHFKLYGLDGKIYEKFKFFKPVLYKEKSLIIEGEEYLGTFSVSAKF